MAIKKKIEEKLKNIYLQKVDSEKKDTPKANTFKVPESRKTSDTKKKTTYSPEDMKFGLKDPFDYMVTYAPKKKQEQPQTVFSEGGTPLEKMQKVNRQKIKQSYSEKNSITAEKKDFELKIRQAEDKLKSTASGIRRASSEDIDTINKLKSDIAGLKDEYNRKFNRAKYFDDKAHQPGENEKRRADRAMAMYAPYVDMLTKNADYYLQHKNDEFKLSDGSIKTGADLYSTTKTELDRRQKEYDEIKRSYEYYKNLTPDDRQALFNERQRAQKAKALQNQTISIDTGKGDRDFGTEDELIKGIVKRYNIDIDTDKGLADMAANFQWGDRYRDRGMSKDESDLLEQYYRRIVAEKLSKGDKLDKAIASMAAINDRIAGGIQLAPQIVKSLATGKDIDLRAEGARRIQNAQTVQQNILQDINNPILRGAYSIGMSMADNIARMPMLAIPVVGEGLLLGTMGASVAAEKATEMTKQGYNAREAVAMGMIAGGIETITEKIGLDNLMNNVVKGNGSWIVNIFRQMGAEGAEEGLADIMNFAADALLHGNDTEFNRKVRAYQVERGLSKEKAQAAAFGEFAVDVLKSTGAGAISGGLFGVGGSAINYGMTSANGKDIIQQGGAIGTLNEGLGFEADTDAYKNAERLTQKMLGEAKGGKTVSNYDIGRQAAMNTEVRAQNRRDIADFSKTFGGNGKVVFTRFYLDGQNTAEYSREMNAAYTAGKLGEAMPENHLRQEQAEAMYAAGYIDNQGKVGIIESRASEAFKADNPDIYKTLDGLGKKYDTRIIIDEAIDGADGYFDPERDELHINANAQSPTMEVVKHELTHMIEGTEEYEELVSFMRENFADEWAQKENDIKGLYERVNAAREIKGLNQIELTDTRLSNEVMAELSEKFESEEFLERVAAENPSMLTKIRDFLKDIINRLKNVFSTEEIKRWEKAERMWENAVKNAEVAERTGDVEYKIRSDKNGNKYWQIETDKDIFANLNTVSEYEDAAYSFILGNRDNKVVYEDINGKKIKFIRLSAKEFTNSDESKLLKKETPDIFKKKMRLIPSLQDLLLNNSVEWESPDFKEHKLFAEKGFRNYRGRVRIDDVIFNSIVRVGMTGKDNIFYDINLEVDSTVPHTNNSASQISKSTSIDTTISQDNGDVNTYNTQKSENDAKYLSAVEKGDTETAKRLVDNAAVKWGAITDEDGNAKVVYHGTDADFTVFDRTKGRSGIDIQGMFFSPWEIDAGGYGKNIGEYYISIKNPASEAIAYKALNMFKGQNYAGIKAREYLEGLGYDGVNNSDEEYIAFYPKQIKSADAVTYDDNGNVIPLSERFNSENSDIRYKLQEPTEVETALAEENAELKRQIEDLQKRAETAERRLETVKTPQVVEKDINKLAGRLIKDYGSDLKRADIADGLRNLGNYILRMGDGKDVYSFDAVNSRAREIANTLIEYAQEETPFADTYKAIKSYFKDKKITITQKGDFPDFEDFRKSVFGKLRIVNEGGSPIDTIWAELGEMYGEGLFPSDITAESDMIQYVADFLTDMSNVYFNPYDTNKAEMRELIANQIISELTDNVRSIKFGDALELNKKLINAEKRIAEFNARKTEMKNKEAELGAEFQKLYEEKAKTLKEKQKLKDQQTERKEREERQRLLRIAQRLTGKRFYNSLSENTKAEIDELIGDLDTAAVGILKTTKNKLSDWANRYNELAAENGFEPNREIEAAIRRLDRKQIQDLNIDEVRSLTDMLITIEHEVHTANRLLAETDNAEIRANGLRIISDIMASGGKKSESISNFLQEVLSPERMINRVVGHNYTSPLVRAFRNMQNGEVKMLKFQMDANRRFRNFTADKKFMKSIQGEKARTITIEGKVAAGRQKVKITPAMLMSLYMHSLNYQNMEHIAKGGLKIPDYDLMQKGERQRAIDKSTKILLDRTDINIAIKQLTKDEIAFCHEVAEFYKWSGEEINKTSNILEGHDIARDGNYFPIFSDENFVNFDLTAISDDGSLSSMGFLNERKNAKNPIYLFDITDVIKRSMENQSRYVGLAVPIRDMNKLLQVADVQAERIEGNDFEDIIARGKREIDFRNSVQQAIKQKWGSETWDYIRKFIDDYQGKNQQRTKNEQTWSKLKSSAAVTALTLNAGVALKQAASYPTAAAELGYTALLKGMFMPVNQKLIEKSPLYWYRQQGWSNAELSEFKANGGHLPKFFNWIQGMDLMTTRRLLSATEAYIRKTQPNLSGEAYEQAVLDKYHDVLRRTQPNYTTLERPGILRDRSFMAQIKSLYRTQPFQNTNILYNAKGDLDAQQRRMSALKADSEEFKEAQKDLKNAKVNYARAITSQAVSSFVFALMQWAVDEWRHKDEDYKDENGEYTFWSVAKKLGINMVGNGFGMIPFGNLMWETLAQGTDNISEIFGGKKIFGVTSYGISDPMFEMIGDVRDTTYNTLMDITKAIAGAAEGEKVDWEALARSSFRTAKAVLAFKNIPLNNAQKELHALLKNTIYAVKGRDEGQYWDLRFEYDPKDNKGKYYDLLYRERKSKSYNTIKKLLIERDGFTEDDINDAMIDIYVKRETPYKNLYELYTKQPERVSEVIKKFTTETAELKGNIYKKMAKMMSEDKKFLDNGFTAEDIQKGTDDVSKEIQRLNKYLKDTEIKLEEETEVEQSNGSLMPTPMPNIIKVGDKDYKFLTANEWKNAETEAQDTARELIEEGINTGYYKNLSDDDKAKYVKKCFTYAKESSKIHITNGKYEPLDKWVATAEKLRKSTKLPITTYIEVTDKCNDVTPDMNANGNTIANSSGVKKKKIIDEHVTSLTARKVLYDTFKVGKDVQSGKITQNDINAKKSGIKGNKNSTSKSNPFLK